MIPIATPGTCSSRMARSTEESIAAGAAAAAVRIRNTIGTRCIGESIHLLRAPWLKLLFPAGDTLFSGVSESEWPLSDESARSPQKFLRWLQRTGLLNHPHIL